MNVFTLYAILPLLVSLFIFPIFAPPYLLAFMMILFKYIIFAECWDMFSSRTGYINLAVSVFFGVGAYTFSLLVTALNISPYFALVASMVIATFLALGIGIITLKPELRGVYFALITFGVNQVFLLVFTNTEALGATYGITLPRVYSPLAIYYALLVLTISVVILAYKIGRSRFGLALAMIREGEMTAESIGLNTTMYKLAVFTISSIFPAIAGALIVSYWSYIDPASAYDLLYTVYAIIMVLIGGPCSVLGPVMGAIIVSSTMEVLFTYFGGYLGGLHGVIFGLTLIVIALAMPGGIIRRIKYLVHV